MAKTRRKKKIKAKKVFHLTWAFENFEEHEDFFTKRMFGGMAAYVHGRMVMLLAEDPGNRSYRDKEYDFDIWNGVLFPTFYEHQESLQREYPDLIQHPVLKKWLYMPVKTADFEDKIYSCSQAIAENDQRFGIFPKV